ncbi:MAG: transcription factor S, partial [Candidatus Hydrothermarchaeales archaeon]
QEFKLTQTLKKKNKLLILEDEIGTLPTTDAECTRCGNTLAEWWLRQTRGADEPETRFFRCTKCKFTWREYN